MTTFSKVRDKARATMVSETATVVQNGTWDYREASQGVGSAVIDHECGAFASTSGLHV